MSNPVRSADEHVVCKKEMQKKSWSPKNHQLMWQWSQMIKKNNMREQQKTLGVRLWVWRLQKQKIRKPDAFFL